MDEYVSPKHIADVAYLKNRDYASNGVKVAPCFSMDRSGLLFIWNMLVPRSSILDMHN